MAQIQNKCENCSQEFCTAVDLEAHRHQGCEQRHIENDSATEVMYCRSDGTLDWRAEKRRNSKMPKQSNRQHIQCEFCEKSFSFKSNYILHLRTIHALKDLYKCNKCGKRFEFRRQLAAHSRLKHVIVNAAERYPCDQCDRTFPTTANLQAHQVNMHSDEFKCDFCHMKFKVKDDLFEHRNVHTDQKYKCEYCNRTFWKKSNLFSHQRYAHFNIRRFECNECGKRYPYKSHLKTHLKSHHPDSVMPEEIYECWCCHKT